MGRESAMLLIVTDDDRLILHLRDDIPGIPHPGRWAGFGGALEAGETTLEALRREVAEETGLELDEARFLVEEFDAEGTRDSVSVFFVQGGIRPEDIDLREGAGIGVHRFEDLDGLRVTPFVLRAIRGHLEPLICG